MLCSVWRCLLGIVPDFQYACRIQSPSFYIGLAMVVRRTLHSSSGGGEFLAIREKRLYACRAAPSQLLLLLFSIHSHKWNRLLSKCSTYLLIVIKAAAQILLLYSRGWTIGTLPIRFLDGRYIHFQIELMHKKI